MIYCLSISLRFLGRVTLYLKLQNAFTIRFTRNTLAEESIIGRKTFSPARTNMPILKLFIS